jgi:uncharacterized protein (UPF0254 family)
MGVVESAGGRKYTLAVLIVLVFLFTIVWLAVTGRLEALIAGIFVSGITAVKGIFDASNSANTRAALDAGKVERDEEAVTVGALDASGVLARAGAATGVDVAGAVGAVAEGTVGAVSQRIDAVGKELSGEAEAARNRLRQAATAGM